MEYDLYEDRRSRLTDMVKRNDCQAILVTNEINVRYLTGFSGDDTWLLVNKDEDLFVSDSRYTEQLAFECPDLAVYCRSMSMGMITKTAEVIQEELPKGTNVGIEGNSMPAATRDALQELLPDFTLVSLNDPVEELREIKDEHEIESIRLAVTCACRAFNSVRHSIRPDDTELEFSRELEYAMLKLGSQERAFPTIVASGKRAALPHAVPKDCFTASGGELLLVDWGAKINSYVSDLTRVLIVTRHPTRKLRGIYNTVLKAQQAAIDIIKPGIPCCEVDAVARRVIADAGHEKAFSHNLGHGLGMVVHDRGGFRMANKTLLKPGMVITVEPGIYYPGWGGVRIEDDILVTKRGCEVLSEGFPKEFDEMFIDW